MISENMLSVTQCAVARLCSHTISFSIFMNWAITYAVALCCCESSIELNGMQAIAAAAVGVP